MFTARQHASVAAVVVVVVGLSAVPAMADPLVAARHEAADGTVFTLTAGSSLTTVRPANRATFNVDADAEDGARNPYPPEGEVSTTRLRLAGQQYVVVGSSIACGRPGATAIYGTAVKKARRIVATLGNGRKVKLSRHKPPKGWKFRGWVIGAVVGVRQPVTKVAAFDKAGRRIARAEFENPQRCR